MVSVCIMRVVAIMFLFCSMKVKQAEMHKAWRSACAYEDSLDLGNAEMLCSENNEGTVPPTQQNKRWFCDTYCDGRGFDRDASESVWDLVAFPAPLETIALIACVPSLVERLYSPESFVVHPPERNGMVHGTIEHRVVGAPAVAHSMSALTEFVVETMHAGVRSTSFVFSSYALVMRDSATGRSELCARKILLLL